tara:strand:+ start:605 stop:1486 length:882 start_codon:yes stop_codon:yes gene_type:complete
LNILLTGSSGFIGSKLAKNLLDNQFNLLTISKKKNIKVSTNHLFVDLNNFARSKKKIKNFNPDIVIHLAWQSLPDYSFNIQMINLEISTLFFEFITNETKCKKIIVAGSCWEYGKYKGACIESKDNFTNSYFSWAKKSLYEYLNFICKKNLIDLIWLRIFFVYGPNQRSSSLVPNIANLLLSKKDIYLNNPYNRHDFIYIDDVVDAFTNIIDLKLKSGIYNIGTGKTYSVLKIAKILNYKINGNKVLKYKTNQNKQNMDRNNFWADINKSRKIFKNINLIDIEEGIQKYLENL